MTGGFVQWKANYTSLLEVVSAVRYDNYQLSSSIGSASGRSFLTKGHGGTFAGGHRDTLRELRGGLSRTVDYRNSGGRGARRNGRRAGVTSPCGPDGQRGFFCFLPNANLRPEVGKNKEIGLNVKKNDIFSAGDSFRGKFNIFRNDVPITLIPCSLTDLRSTRSRRSDSIPDNLSSVSEHRQRSDPGLRDGSDV